MMKRIAGFLTCSTTCGISSSSPKAGRNDRAQKMDAVKDKFLHADSDNSLAMVVNKRVDFTALKPLENVWGGGPKKPVSPIGNRKLKKLDGTFKYCVTSPRPARDRIDLLVTDNISAAHVGMLKIANDKNHDVVMAGHVTLQARKGKKSEVYSITGTSGHLQPECTYEQQQVAELAFIEQGLESSQGKFRYKSGTKGVANT